MLTLKTILDTIRLVGPGGTLRILRYSIERDQSDHQFRRAHPLPREDIRVAPGNLRQVDVQANGARVTYQNAGLEIIFLAPDLARLSWSPGSEPIPYAIEKSDWPETKLENTQTVAGFRLSSSEMQVIIQKDGGVQFLDSAGTLLCEQVPPYYQGTADNAAWSGRARLRSEEHLYGLGEQSGPLDLRGASRRLWNTDPAGSYGPGDEPIYMPMPVYLGLHEQGNYLVFYENYHPGQFVSDPRAEQLHNRPHLQTEAEAECRLSFAGGMLRYYFIPGPPQRCLERFTELTGRAPLPPLWSLGYHQSRWGYKTAEEIRQVASGFREHNLPLSAIHLDIDYMHGYRVFSVDDQRFPNLRELTAELGAQGIHLVAILDPGVKRDPEYPLYQDGLAKGFFCTLPDGKPIVGVVWPGESVFPDFTSPAARQWWSEQYPSLLDLGIAGFWHDMNEPTSFTLHTRPYLPLAVRHDLDGQGGDHRQGHNLYALQMNRAGQQALLRYRPDRRPWIISRSGWVSQQRYAWNWSGDTETSWDSLWMTIATVLGTGLCGQPYNGPDIGGFSGDPSAELYLRWLQLGTFLPFFRTHSVQGAARREPWVFGEPYTSIIRQFLQLRYRLLPYLYTLAWQANQSGAPLVRPLFWDAPQDPRLWAIDDAFLLGENLLVAPILEEGSKRRKVMLPPGRWLSFWDDHGFQGPGMADVHCGLATIPLLVRAGSVLPLAEGQRLALHIYSPHREPVDGSAGCLYSDAGDGYGAWRVERFAIQGDYHHFNLFWQSEGDFPFPYTELELLWHGTRPQKIDIDGQEYPAAENLVLNAPFREIHLQA
jgi:alpha-glucosidase